MAETRVSKSVAIPLNLLPSVLLVAVAWLIGPLSDLGQSADDPSQTQPRPAATADRPIEFSRELPDGVKVEFVGLAKMSTEEKDAKSWWTPDGSPLGFAPAYWGGLTVGGERKYVRTIFHVHGINDTKAVTVTSATKRPISEDSVFWIASMTKMFAGASIMILADECTVSLDDPVTKFIPHQLVVSISSFLLMSIFTSTSSGVLPQTSRPSVFGGTGGGSYKIYFPNASLREIVRGLFTSANSQRVFRGTSERKRQTVPSANPA
jgi:hypothetical protein